MATVTIQSEPESGRVPEGACFTLRATVKDGSSDDAYQWQLDGTDISGATSQDFKDKATDQTIGVYTVVATVNGDALEADEAKKIEIQPNPVADPDGEQGKTESPPTFHPWFAGISAGVAFVIGGAILIEPARTAGEIVKGDWLGKEGGNALAATVAVPLTVIGGVLIVLGAWMAAVEWRGRFKGGSEGQARGPAEINFAEVIAAIGKLRGAAIVLVVGSILMLGAAWIAQAAAGGPTSEMQTTTTTTSPSTSTPPEAGTSTTPSSEQTAPGDG